MYKANVSLIAILMVLMFGACGSLGPKPCPICTGSPVPDEITIQEASEQPEVPIKVEVKKVKHRRGLSDFLILEDFEVVQGQPRNLSGEVFVRKDENLSVGDVVELRLVVHNHWLNKYSWFMGYLAVPRIVNK